MNRTRASREPFVHRVIRCLFGVMLLHRLHVVATAERQWGRSGRQLLKRIGGPIDGLYGQAAVLGGQARIDTAAAIQISRHWAGVGCHIDKSVYWGPFADRSGLQGGQI